MNFVILIKNETQHEKYSFRTRAKDFQNMQQRTENPCVGSSILPGATTNVFMKALTGFFILPILSESPLLYPPVLHSVQLEAIK